ncbi:hypothetical protein [Leptospira sarikeiensis]|uniref:MORN repeat-containing protein 3 n=1 Tax=Leptospira sarikeiensis TaxID=2484943 RepID=A0A4R9KBD0_9LEPT|nr:hypothetical protein [Leptospira sarikeiensis]TGL63366.1 hypothetical protein EHQ64_05250 [Leptospira sarikeiensis]
MNRKLICILILSLFLFSYGNCATVPWKCVSGETCNAIKEGSVISQYGHTYHGELKNGIPDGVGSVEFGSGRWYNIYINGYALGSPIHGSVGNPGDRYEGGVGIDKHEDIQLNGKGTLFYKDGSKIETTWKENKPEGKGKITPANGQSLEGNFYDGGWICLTGDCKNGSGKRIYKNCAAFEKGTFVKGELMKGLYVSDESELMDGEWRMDGKFKRFTSGIYKIGRQMNSLDRLRQKDSPKVQYVEVSKETIQCAEHIN